MKRVVFLLILIQAAFCLNALAEESWVLWAKHEVFGSKGKKRTCDVTWEVIDGYAKEAECKDARERVVAFEKKKWEAMKAHNVQSVGGGSTDIVIIGDEGIQAIIYCCLPGTIDPRK
jgi:hypothetical protein